MNTQQAYINGFVKRAAQYGLTDFQAMELLKQGTFAAGANPMPDSAGSTTSAGAAPLSNAFQAGAGFLGNMFGGAMGAPANSPTPSTNNQNQMPGGVMNTIGNVMQHPAVGAGMNFLGNAVGGLMGGAQNTKPAGGPKASTIGAIAN